MNAPVVTQVRSTRTRAPRLPEHLERKVRHSSYVVLFFALIGLLFGGLVLAEELESLASGGSEVVSGIESAGWAYALQYFGGGAVLLACFLAARRFPVPAFGVVLLLDVAVTVASALRNGLTGMLWFGLLSYVCVRAFQNARELEKVRRKQAASGSGGP